MDETLSQWQSDIYFKSVTIVILLFIEYSKEIPEI